MMIALLSIPSGGCFLIQRLKSGMDKCFEPEQCSSYACCRYQGRCSHNGTRCAPRNDEDCQQSEVCRSDGRCKSLAVLKVTRTLYRDTFYEMVDRETVNQCVVGHTDHCAQSEACKSRGDCDFAVNYDAMSFDFYLECAPTQPEHCEQSEECTQRGINCTYHDPANLRITTSGNRSAFLAQQAFGRQGMPPPPGECTNESDAACRASKECTIKGRCFVSIAGFCEAGRQEDCETSTGCKDEGNCTLIGSYCKPSEDAHCKRSKQCQAEGKCTFLEGGCGTVTDEECRESSICKTQGRCAAISSSELGSIGVNMKGKFCIASSAEACAQSDECKTKGKCDYQHRKDCFVSIQSCQESEVCKTLGQCTPDQHSLECIKSP